MKIFIAGTKSLQKLDTPVLQRMMSIYQKGYCVLVGDCCGVDSSVQKFYSGLGYGNVVVYASNGKARNNIGNWQIRNVPVPSYFRGFDFYKQKDIAMANDADYGFMIWDGESRGTLNNINMPKRNGIKASRNYCHCFSVFQVGCNLVHGLYGEVTLINLYAMHLLKEEFCKLVAI